MTCSLRILIILALAATSSLVLAGQLNQTYVEIDVIFPRNETYKPADNFPIALVVQNITGLGSIGNYFIHWAIMPYIEGRIPDIGLRWNADFALPRDNTGSKPVILVDTLNVTEWIHTKARGERYMLHWSITWDNRALSVRCGGNGYVLGGIMFGLEAKWEKDYNATVGWIDGGKGIEPDILQVPEYPALGQPINITPSTTATSCPTLTYTGPRREEEVGRQGDPCAVKVDKSVASSISSHAASLATARLPPTRTLLDSTANNGAWLAVRPVQTALAAACFVAGLLLSDC
ncbi:hypothetical protein VFPPC_03864 [Pochonia chlamydosporia 170]|uniref:DUF7136 domain-containing protein n=1 Tax=Pochonia chlamydosporia 170 TaxID=1380566 RepID=A0A179F2I3_METCM|nr:hypothetical protein VFPPC_03864 [Pochonia chlamydosporia 170]OAQ59655.1 hypothetical protein VFPPC_03864 [Pochonia chlamydosporia 170]